MLVIYQHVDVFLHLESHPEVLGGCVVEVAVPILRFGKLQENPSIPDKHCPQLITEHKELLRAALSVPRVGKHLKDQVLAPKLS